MSEDSAVVRVGGWEVPLEKSETGDFGVTKDELRLIICERLSTKNRGTMKQRALFGSVLNSMRLNPRGEKKEAMLKVFVGILREMRNDGIVAFRSGKTAVFVTLGRIRWDTDRGSAAGQR